MPHTIKEDMTSSKYATKSWVMAQHAAQQNGGMIGAMKSIHQ
jgi:hypothetical protein